ncbi:2Fe-2S iron-sulfur cluster binding domain-containing protein [Martelella lutilitoris]|uniref:2Fe-2S iron-sulfur cluster binding domain-containing protein n=1 Tax=Martelella lutilitoris TaxID=2583532 RepID=A0A7T7HGR3_9HYPH|nr:2Fe-2S iron-sulfur cluster binding domain-containing protein [Martelella lutilitoris]QQM28891.1 2Fe-2S iron-sulfur cluster binding domain-containing protein [Martelella lutilitoris]
MTESNATKEHAIRIAGRSKVFSCRDGEPVLFSIERATSSHERPPVRIGCRRGGCGACRVRVISGSYETLKMSRYHVSEQEQEEGYALSCRLIARSDLVIEPAYRPPRAPDETRNERQREEV